MLPMAPRKDYAPGDIISSKYRLFKLLGEGGMGSVWVAENMALKANVALKLIRADVAESSANERFLSEARLAARLQHAAIVRVFDFGTTDNDEPFIVMELLEGETLGQRLTRLGSIDPAELCQMLLPIIDALHSAHGHGVIHRDLKPDNVFISKTDGGGVQPKLLDFGIAKLRGEGANFTTTKLTQAGTLIGSPDYMSPEQARGELDLDCRSDVWALCVLAYECVVGKPPFHGDNYNALLWAIIHDEPVPITVFQAGDSELWRLLKTGFAKDRNQRWDNAKRFGEALAGWLENQGVVEDICNRSLHASWLPAERPTRPELAPSDPMAAPPPPRMSSHEALVPPPTLPSLRRPHTFSLWFAGLGLITLLAVFLAYGGDDDAEELTAAPKAEVTSSLRASKPEADRAITADPAPAQPPAGDPARAADVAPIGAANIESTSGKSSWTNNHDRPLKVKDLELAEEFNSKVTGSGDGRKDSSPKRTTAPKAGASSPSETPPRTKTARPASKKPAADKAETSDFDFGI